MKTKMHAVPDAVLFALWARSTVEVSCRVYLDAPAATGEVQEAHREGTAEASRSESSVGNTPSPCINSTTAADSRGSVAMDLAAAGCAIEDPCADQSAQRLDISLEEIGSLYSALQDMYDDQLYPLVTSVKARLQQQMFTPRLLPHVLDLYSLFPEYVIEHNADADLEVIRFRRTPKSFRGWVDPNSSDDLYPEDMWAKFGEYIEKLSINKQNKTLHTELNQAPFVFHRGRYGMALELQGRNLDFFNGKSLGELCHIVELAIKKRKLLAYEHNLLLPAHACKSFTNASVGIPTPNCSITDGDLGCKYISNYEELKRCVEDVFHYYEEGFNLSALKMKIRETSGKCLSETTFHYAKLLDLVKAPPLNEVCVLQKLEGKRGYMMGPRKALQQEVATTLNLNLCVSPTKPCEMVEKRRLPHAMLPNDLLYGDMNHEAVRPRRATSSASTEAKDYFGSTGVSEQSPISSMSFAGAASRYDSFQMGDDSDDDYTSSRANRLICDCTSRRSEDEDRLDFGVAPLSRHTTHLPARRDVRYRETNDHFLGECIQVEPAAQDRYNTAQGRYSTAQDRYSTAQGRYSTAQDRYSTAKDRYSTTQDRYSATQGRYNTAQDRYSTAQGRYSTAQDRCSTVQGRYSTAQDRYSTAKDRYSTAQDRYSATQGRYNTSQDRYSTAQDRYSTAQDRYSATQGRYNTAQDRYSATQGRYNSAQGRYNTAQGRYSNASTHCELPIYATKVHFPRDEPIYLSTLPDYYATPLLGEFEG